MSELLRMTLRTHPMIARRSATPAQDARVGALDDNMTLKVVLPSALLAVGSTALLFTGSTILGAAGLIATPFVYSKLSDINAENA